MTAHFPPFTKPEAAYDSARLYRETSEIAAAQDARLNNKPRDDLHSIMANLRADLTRAYENAKCRIDAIDRAQKLSELANEAQAWGMYEPATLRDETLHESGIGDVPRHPSVRGGVMSQTRLGSFVESWANIGIGFAINWSANMLVLPLFGFAVTGGQAFGIGVIFTGISLARSYCLRRWFNGLRWGQTEARP